MKSKYKIDDTLYYYDFEKSEICHFVVEEIHIKLYSISYLSKDGLEIPEYCVAKTLKKLFKLLARTHWLYGEATKILLKNMKKEK